MLPAETPRGTPAQQGPDDYGRLGAGLMMAPEVWPCPLEPVRAQHFMVWGPRLASLSCALRSLEE